MLQSPLEINKEILGYKLKERIGSGGFGEVWSAEAPGGLLKAVKIVFGYHDGKRAQAELKALDRVKELRHPFLLSLERIEVFEGQLVVVSELADRSLADEFNLHIADGKSGISREDMLRYTRCSAEALDYLSESHGLQHLDIKPENLLLIGTHVKVADFGLIKDLQQASQSLMSGMTPAYAAPELFDGRPGKTSDQYSLAIVYQEMLTGSRPFPGTTPAQLAAQHINGKPDLTALPSSDQGIIAKALAKDPSARFQSCIEMVEELTNRRRSGKKSSPRRTVNRDSDETNTLKLDSNNHEVTALISGNALPFQANEVKVLDPPSCDATDTAVRPTLYVGIGSTGNKIIQKIKTQLVARYGSMENLPSFKLHAIDSDREAVNEIIRTSTSPLEGKELIETPLKKPEAYRDQKKSHLNWLSRRWIYNIPRTLQTEGLRPLGRLAYSDNFDRIYNTLEESIREISKPENLAATADTLDIDPGSLTPRIIVVTSISGGLGSGMALDLAYSLRLLMHESGHQPDSVVGIMLHSTYQRLRDPGLSSANAFAFLTELRHFCELGFPGDADNGVPDFEETVPFDFTYFEDLGQNLCQSEFDQKLEGVAEYAMLASASKCASFFDECRAYESEEEDFALRTFGISVTGPGKFEAGLKAAQLIGSQLIRYWISGDEQTSGQVQTLIETLTAENQLSTDEVCERIQSSIEAATQEDLTSLLNQVKDNPSFEPLELVKSFDRIYLTSTVRPVDEIEEPKACLVAQQEVKRWAPELGEQVVAVIQKLMDGKSMNLALAYETSTQFTEKLRENVKQLQRTGRELGDAETQALNNISNLIKSRTSLPGQIEQAVKQYAAARKLLTVYRYARSLYRTISGPVDSLQRTLHQYRRQLETVALGLQTDSIASSTETKTGFCMETLLSESIQQQVHEHLLKTEELVYDSLISDYGGYKNALESSALWQNQLKAQVSKQAERVLADAYKKLSLDQVLAENSVPPEQLAQWLNDQMQQASPNVSDCGGGTRLMIGIPSLSEDNSVETMLAKQFELQACKIRGTDGCFTFCFEGEGVGLANVAYRLLQERPDALELVKRIPTRCDVEWKSLNDLL